ncbi:unnamed protein product [Owenia fusiformis]|uniref:Uncharacterized protein n=1 Tax=Owenia fusiformis TaxID=6347 RepID=A0A8S4NML6_OWEFU|nr:unnamed protein product [Owenia fusiformis]
MANGYFQISSACLIFLVVSVQRVVGSKVLAASVEGIRLEDESGIVKDGVPFVVAGTNTKVRLFGSDFSSKTELSFTTKLANRSDDCDDLRSTDVYHVVENEIYDTSAIFDINIPLVYDGAEYFLICVKEVLQTKTNETVSRWIHQGDKPWLRLSSFPAPKKTTLLPLPVQILMVGVLLCLSGLCSGLNLGLMAIDCTELKIIQNVGSEQEKKYAKAISPVRQRGNFLLCTILLGNVLVNNTLTILMDDLTGSGFIAVIIATMGIVIFGEIIPQAVCSRHGLAIGAKTIWVTYIFMILTFPISFPISKLLDCLLGEEIGTVYNRTRLRELLTVTQEYNDLQKDELNIITGALELSKKTVKDVMTRIEDVYSLQISAVLDFDTMSNIMKKGYTRIPVFDDDRRNIVQILNIKDLAFVDPDDNTPLRSVCKFYNHPVNFCFEDQKLDAMLEEFKKGKSHIAFVQRVNNEGEGDPFYETIGIVTLEDVIEEIIQSEIVDETDTVMDNIKKAPRQNMFQNKDFSVFNQPDSLDAARVNISPQLALATVQFLTTVIEPFKVELISETVTTRLIKQNVIFNLKINSPEVEDNQEKKFLYNRGQSCDYFILILQGRVEVMIGNDNMVFEGGPFTYYGCQALQGTIDVPLRLNALPANLNQTNNIHGSTDSLYRPKQSYIPDFTVKATSDLQYLKVKRSHYIAARRATLMERTPKTPEVQITDEDQFAKEWQRATSLDPDKPTINNIDKLAMPANSVSMNDIDLVTKEKHENGKPNDVKRGRGNASESAEDDKADAPLLSRRTSEPSLNKKDSEC